MSNDEHRRTPATRRRLSGLRLGIIVAAVVVVGFAAIPVVGLGLYAHSMTSEPVGPVTRHVTAMPCATWSTGTSAGGGDTSGAHAEIQVGLGASCTEKQIEAINDYLGGAFRHSAIDQLTFYVSPTSKGGDLDGYSTTGIPSLDVDTTEATLTDVRRSIADWVALRRTVDANTQIDLTDSFDATATPVEILTVAAAQNSLPHLRSTLSKHLLTAAWSLTIDTRSPGAAFDQANTTDRSAGRIETQSGFPSAELVNLAVAASRGWPRSDFVDVSTGTSPAVKKQTEQDVALRVFGLGTSDVASPEKTVAWPQLTGTIDRLDASGSPFVFGLGLYRDTFSDDPTTSPDTTWDFTDTAAEVDDADLGIITSSTCGTGTGTEASAIGAVLHAYWLSPTRHRAADWASSRCR